MGKAEMEDVIGDLFEDEDTCLTVHRDQRETDDAPKTDGRLSLGTNGGFRLVTAKVEGGTNRDPGS